MQTKKQCRALAVPALLAALAAGTGNLNAMPIKVTTFPGLDDLPSWDPTPGSNLIAYRTARQSGTNSILNSGGVEFTGSGGQNERSLATGSQNLFGVASFSSSWVGNTGRLVINETLGLHEYLSFVPDKVAPFSAPNRGFATGSNAGFTLELIIPGGGGGGFMEVSRDGSTAMWRHSTSGGGGFQQIRVAPFADLVGQSANAGIAGAKQVVSVNGGANQEFLSGAALSFNGDIAIVAEDSGAGTDLFRYDTTALNPNSTRTQLTFTGQELGHFNGRPNVSPNNNHIAFHRSNPDGVTSDIYAINLDGSGLHAITNTGDAVSFGHPSWSPNGSHVAMASGGDIWVQQVFGVDPNAPPPVFPNPPVQNGGLNFNLNGQNIGDPGSQGTSLGGLHRASVSALVGVVGQGQPTDRHSSTRTTLFNFTGPGDQNVFIHALLNGTMLAQDGGRSTASASLQMYDAAGNLITATATNVISLDSDVCLGNFCQGESLQVNQLLTMEALLTPGAIYDIRSNMSLFASAFGGLARKSRRVFQQQFRVRHLRFGRQSVRHHNAAEPERTTSTRFVMAVRCRSVVGFRGQAFGATRLIRRNSRGAREARRRASFALRYAPALTAGACHQFQTTS